MKDEVLMELVKRWERESVEPQTMDGSESAKILNAVARGERQAKRECADALRLLVQLLGDDRSARFVLEIEAAAERCKGFDPA